MCDWLRADAAERQWQSLLDIARAQRLEALGNARFAPLLWLGGSLTLNAPGAAST
ncbi:hypothetical protein [Diaphorobacter sp.]|uniref:hypothetical protein n=1 Tax=Diaphorobacter sp. TaxID=1934310 RepID=UPI00258E38B6|nr:hypothetical protein [Diaphorobacter sp.]